MIYSCGDSDVIITRDSDVIVAGYNDVIVTDVTGGSESHRSGDSDVIVMGE